MRHRKPAQAMVEFGLIALLFVLLLFGIADFGMLLNGWLNVSSSASAAARQAAVSCSKSADQVIGCVTDTAQTFAKIPGVNPTTLKVLVTYCKPDDASCTPGSDPTYCLAGRAPTGMGCLAGTPNPSIGDTVMVTIVADTFEVSTPLVRPFFSCPPTGGHCYVPLKSAASVRYEGRGI